MMAKHLESSAASLLALAKGSQCPAQTPGVMRLYNMRFCPFAQRTRLVLEYKNIPYEMVNVNLKFKPDWFLQKNPRGLVPVLEIDDKILYESTICNEFLEEAYPDPPLLPTDPYKRVQVRLLIDNFSQISSAFNGLKSRNPEKKVKAFQGLNEHLLLYEDALTDKYFGGVLPNLLDLHIWPWFERLPALTILSGGLDLLPAESFPRLAAWTGRMRAVDAVRRTAMSDQLHVAFMQSFATGTPAYDAGLVPDAAKM